MFVISALALLSAVASMSGPSMAGWGNHAQMEDIEVSTTTPNSRSPLPENGSVPSRSTVTSSL